MKPELAIIHFNPIEQYPPVMNFIKVLEQENLRSVVYTMHPPRHFKLFSTDSPVRIFRSGKTDRQRRLGRLLNYIQFYTSTTIQLFVSGCRSVLYYETNSFLPAWIYSRVMKIAGRKIRVFCHYHEYTTEQEYENGMKLTAWLHKKEQGFYKNLSGISHTNQKRSSLFTAENDYKNEVIVFPNYPPSSWSAGSAVKEPNGLPLKLVYVGALDPDTMYVKEMAEWIKHQKGTVLLDIYTNQKAGNAIQYLEKLDCNYITLKGPVEYYSMPEVLKHYDIGLVLYKGMTPNYVHNETNKLFEYLSCGLSVWYSDRVKGIDKHSQQSTFPKVIPVNFESIQDDLIDVTLSPANGRKVFFNAESAIKTYLERIKTNE